LHEGHKNSLLSDKNIVSNPLKIWYNEHGFIPRVSEYGSLVGKVLWGPSFRLIRTLYRAIRGQSRKSVNGQYQRSETGRIAMDMEYMKYLMQDMPPVKENGKVKYVFCADYVYRSLFCKDIFFRQEQEYRIVLPEESISEGKHYPVKFSTGIQMMPMDEFMK
jgi:hypothetical protein